MLSKNRGLAFLAISAIKDTRVVLAADKVEIIWSC